MEGERGRAERKESKGKMEERWHSGKVREKIKDRVREQEDKRKRLRRQGQDMKKGERGGREEMADK